MGQYTGISPIRSLAAEHALSSLCHQLDQLDSRVGGTDMAVELFEYD